MLAIHDEDDKRHGFVTELVRGSAPRDKRRARRFLKEFTKRFLAARKAAPAIGTTALNEAFERIVAGPERGKQILSPQERRVVAYHEAGHALVMESMANADPVHKMSIISRGAALSYTLPLPERDKLLRSKEASEDEIAGLVGGLAAEELFCGGITTGAANDLQRATALARAMVTQYGMSEELGLRIFGTREAAFPRLVRAAV